MGGPNPINWKHLNRKNVCVERKTSPGWTLSSDFCSKTGTYTTVSPSSQAFRPGPELHHWACQLQILEFYFQPPELHEQFLIIYICTWPYWFCLCGELLHTPQRSHEFFSKIALYIYIYWSFGYNIGTKCYNFFSNSIWSNNIHLLRNWSGSAGSPWPFTSHAPVQQALPCLCAICRLLSVPQGLTHWSSVKYFHIL